MTKTQSRPSAATTPTRSIELEDRRLAYRCFGDGPPIVLCLRFRGVLDSWDPAFLDALAETFTVVTFEYSGIGASTGAPSYERESLARDAIDLVDALGFDHVVIAGWSLGGIAAQIFAARHPERATHAILIGTVPPGPQPHESEPIFLPTATRFENDLADETVLFFEPASERSRAAAARSHARIAARTAERSPVVPEPVYLDMLRRAHDPAAVFPDPDGLAARLATGRVPLLVLSGDHDIVFPVENWYALNRVWKSMYVVTIPSAGHGPQHEEPEFCAEVIDRFVRHVEAS